MKIKQKKNNLPQNVCAFYIRLYCDRKRSAKTKYESKLIEATKSWLSLSESEKQQFSAKYKECKEKYRAAFFSKLKNAEPFMKIKTISSRNDDPSNNHLENFVHEEGSLEQHIHEDSTVHTHIEETAEPTLDSDETNLQIPDELNIDEQHENETETVDRNSIAALTTLIEPLAPAIKTGHELFKMLNSTDETNNITWESLPQLEKNQYRRAVSIMKKDYISKYKEYLESLSPEALFDYYNKTIF